MTRPLLLDLFCGAGGAAVGYHRAGFDVVGVDIAPQPFYPFTFVRADAFAPPFALAAFKAIHASPPCQHYSTMGNRKRLPAPDLIGPTLALLRTTGLPWILENVGGAAPLLPDATILTGGMFGLRVHRPRRFASNVLLLAPARRRPLPGAVGVYGRAPDGRRLASHDAWIHAADGLDDARDAMGMDWADWHGTKEAIPPAYTEWLGTQLIREVALSEMESVA